MTSAFSDSLMVSGGKEAPPLTSGKCISMICMPYIRDYSKTSHLVSKYGKAASSHNMLNILQEYQHQHQKSFLNILDQYFKTGYFLEQGVNQQFAK